jgi:hypothetical protein
MSHDFRQATAKNKERKERKSKRKERKKFRPDQMNNLAKPVVKRPRRKDRDPAELFEYKQGITAGQSAESFENSPGLAPLSLPTFFLNVFVSPVGTLRE